MVVRTRSYSKTIKVTEDGTFHDTLAVDVGLFDLHDGTESTAIFLKNGFELDLTLDTKEFDETIKYTGIGAEHSNFLAKSNLLREEILNMDELSTIAPSKLDSKFETIKVKLNEFYNSNKSVDTSITNKFIKQVDPMLKYYKKAYIKFYLAKN